MFVYSIDCCFAECKNISLLGIPIFPLFFFVLFVIYFYTFYYLIFIHPPTSMQIVSCTNICKQIIKNKSSFALFIIRLVYILPNDKLIKATLA